MNEYDNIDSSGGDLTNDEEITFLTIEQVIILHSDVLADSSPHESREILSRNLLESAVMTPQQTFGGEYLYNSLSSMAAAYLIGLCSNHAFQNGNKRIGFAACSTFLRANGYQLSFSQQEAVKLTLDVVKHNIGREELTAVLENAMDPL